MMRKPFFSFLGLIVVAVVAGAALAAPSATSNDSGKTKHLRFDSLTVTGEASKPQVFYLLNRKKIQLHHRPEEKDLTKALEESVKGEPF